MQKLKLIWKILFGRGRYAFVVYDYRNLPVEGDTLRVGHMLATFVETDTIELAGNLITFVGEMPEPGGFDFSPVQQMSPMTQYIESLQDLQREQLRTSIKPMFIPEGMKLIEDKNDHA